MSSWTFSRYLKVTGSPSKRTTLNGQTDFTDWTATPKSSPVSGFTSSKQTASPEPSLSNFNWASTPENKKSTLSFTGKASPKTQTNSPTLSFNWTATPDAKATTFTFDSNAATPDNKSTCSFNWTSTPPERKSTLKLSGKLLTAAEKEAQEKEKMRALAEIEALLKPKPSTTKLESPKRPKSSSFCPLSDSPSPDHISNSETLSIKADSKKKKEKKKKVVWKKPTDPETFIPLPEEQIALMDFSDQVRYRCYFAVVQQRNQRYQIFGQKPEVIELPTTFTFENEEKPCIVLQKPDPSFPSQPEQTLPSSFPTSPSSTFAHPNSTTLNLNDTTTTANGQENVFSNDLDPSKQPRKFLKPKRQEKAPKNVPEEESSLKSSTQKSIQDILFSENSSDSTPVLRPTRVHSFSFHSQKTMPNFSSSFLLQFEEFNHL